MNIRGIAGFIVDGEEYIQYIHQNSEPWNVGNDMIAEWKDMLKTYGSLEGVAAEIRKIEMVGGMEIMPNSSDRKWCEELLPQCGKLKYAVENSVMMDDAEFWENKIFCIWGHVFNLDSGFLEVYVFGDELLTRIPLEDMPATFTEDMFLEETEEDADS